VRRLVQKLNDPSQPLSRNRHFHTFESPEGKVALKVSRRLLALGKDLLACRSEGRVAQITRQVDPEGHCRLELILDRVHGRRLSLLDEEELELLAELPGVREALSAALR
jgi:hypothetical protein